MPVGKTFGMFQRRKVAVKFVIFAGRSNALFYVEFVESIIGIDGPPGHTRAGARAPFWNVPRMSLNRQRSNAHSTDDGRKVDAL
jgi:hypothetical protein